MSRRAERSPDRDDPLARRLHHRLLLVHVAIALVIVLATGTALVALRSAMQQAERARALDHELSTLDHARADARELARSARRYLLAGDTHERQRVTTIERALTQQRERLRAASEALDRALGEYVSTVVRSLASAGDDPRAALGRFEEDVTQARAQLMSRFDDLVARERAQLEASRSSHRLASGAQWALVVAALLGVLLVIGSSLATSRVLRPPVERARPDVVPLPPPPPPREPLPDEPSVLR